MDLRLDDPVAALVGHSKLQRIDAIAWPNYREFAEHHSRGGARELRERQTCHDREAKQSDDGFERDQQIGDVATGNQLSVADSGESLHAEEERVAERSRPRVLD